MKKNEEVLQADNMVNLYRVHVGLNFLCPLVSKLEEWFINVLPLVPFRESHM